MFSQYKKENLDDVNKKGGRIDYDPTTGYVTMWQEGWYSPDLHPLAAFRTAEKYFKNFEEFKKDLGIIKMPKLRVSKDFNTDAFFIIFGGRGGLDNWMRDIEDRIDESRWDEFIEKFNEDDMIEYIWNYSSKLKDKNINSIAEWIKDDNNIYDIDQGIEQYIYSIGLELEEEYPKEESRQIKEETKWKTEVIGDELPEDIYWNIVDIMEAEEGKSFNIDQETFVFQREPDNSISIMHDNKLLDNINTGYTEYYIFDNFMNESKRRNNVIKYKKEEVNMNEIVVFDNGGKSIDKYTIINTETGDVYSADDNPFHPQGFGQYGGNIISDRGFKKFNNSIGDYIEQAEKDPDWLGEEVKDLNSLPPNVIKYIQQMNESKRRNNVIKYKKESEIDDISSTTKTVVDNQVDVQEKPKKSEKEKKPKEKDMEPLKEVDKEDETITSDKKIENMYIDLQNIVENTPVGEIKLSEKSIKHLDSIMNYCMILKEIKEVNK